MVANTWMRSICGPTVPSASRRVRVLHLLRAGKFTAETQFGAGDFRQSWQDDPAQRAVFLDDLRQVERVGSLADGRSLAQLAVQCVLAQRAVSTVMPGAKHAQQIWETAQARSRSPLTEDELATCAMVTPPGGGRKIWPA